VFVKNCVRSSKLKKGSVTRNKLFVPINRSLYVSYHNGNKPLLKQVLSVTKHREYPIGLGASTITIDSLSIPPYSCLTLPYFNKDQPVHCDNFRLALSAEVSQAEWQSFQSTSQFSEAIWQYGEGDIGSVSILTRPFPEGTEGRSCYAGRYLDKCVLGVQEVSEQYTPINTSMSMPRSGNVTDEETSNFSTSANPNLDTWREIDICSAGWVCKKT